jgi:hypothetical protein
LLYSLLYMISHREFRCSDEEFGRVQCDLKGVAERRA